MQSLTTTEEEGGYIPKATGVADTSASSKPTTNTTGMKQIGTTPEGKPVYVDANGQTVVGS